MIYDIRQVTTYDYASPVAFSTHILRLLPKSRAEQRVNSAHLAIEPRPTSRVDTADFFGNAVTRLTIEEPHKTLALTMTARVKVEPPRAIDPEATPPWERVRDLALASADLSAQSPVHFLFGSRRVGFSPAIRAYVAESLTPGRPILAAVLDLTRRVQRDFVYDTDATEADTPPEVAFAIKRGVCQDFTHVMISGLRALGLPAAYVSGFLRTIPPPGKARLEGADATHAWVSAWCGREAGWVGFDPTNGILASVDHITLAVGRDYADVSPTDGVVIASGGQELKVAVDVMPVEPDAAKLRKKS